MGDREARQGEGLREEMVAAQRDRGKGVGSNGLWVLAGLSHC